MTPAPQGSPLMRLVLDREGRRIVLAGEVDVSNAADLREALEALQAEPGDVAIHLAQVSFMDLAGCRAIEEAARALGARRLILAAPPPPVRRLFTIIGLEEMANVSIPVADDVGL
jgi:anti-anti-sigma factor